MKHNLFSEFVELTLLPEKKTFCSLSEIHEIHTFHKKHTDGESPSSRKGTSRARRTKSKSGCEKMGLRHTPERQCSH